MGRPKLLEKPCRECGIVFPREHFHFSDKAKDLRRSRCRKCSVAYQGAWVKANREKVNARRREKYCPEKGRRGNLTRYGLTPETYDEILESQGGVCAVCRERPLWRGIDRLHVDHSHESGKVRGLLCYACNTSLGALKEDISRIRALADYLTLFEEDKAAEPEAS